MDMMDITGKEKVHKHFLEDESEEDQDNIMESMHYRVSNQQNEVPFRVISDSDGVNNSHTITTNVQAVLASPLNGQFYVIGSPSDVLGAVGQRQIVPRSFNEQPVSSAKEERQGNRRATHNEVERRRRDNINNWIMKLGKLIPPDYIVILYL
ncbi:upstream stimulatory factor 1 [Eurytemora carolleeae]|uniref:upstream stimulatory factor 1 n=1 Tax=Eurytemora carolleeae TaxID=1294199 RepID=UPI000C75D99E|nr:upstream stimulatory factor 1 [Eurytemora carolleeae]|eukprot:XP_023331488.1 upstream stimulatory factor 1-like [Eurytemora affinis]